MKHCALLLLSCLAVAAPALAQSADPRVPGIEKRLDAAIAEIERLKLGGAADSSAARLESRLGFAPGASKVYGLTEGVSIGGYGEVLFSAFDRRREDGARSGLHPQGDALRAVLYVGHKFDDRLLFNSEIELEHGGVVDEAEVSVDPLTGEGGAELSGEARLEFAYLDWRLRPELGVRAGLVLVPLGIVNEQHEPPVFFGALRPDV